jgi:hypothetical protein
MYYTHEDRWATLPEDPDAVMDLRGFAAVGDALVVVGGMGRGQAVSTRTRRLLVATPP